MTFRHVVVAVLLYNHEKLKLSYDWEGAFVVGTDLKKNYILFRPLKILVKVYFVSAFKVTCKSTFRCTLLLISSCVANIFLWFYVPTKKMRFLGQHYAAAPC